MATTYVYRHLNANKPAETSGEFAPGVATGWQASLLQPQTEPAPIRPSTPPGRLSRTGKGRPRGSRNKSPPTPPPLSDVGVMAVRVPEAARRMSLSVTAVKELVTTGKLRSLKVGATRLIPISSIVAFLEDGK